MQPLWPVGPGESSPPGAALLWRQALPACEKDPVAAAEDGNRRRLPGQPAREPETVASTKPGLLAPLPESAFRSSRTKLSAPTIAEPEASAPGGDCKNGHVPASFSQKSKDVPPHPPGCKDGRVSRESDPHSSSLSRDCKKGLDTFAPPLSSTLSPRETWKRL